VGHCVCRYIFKQRGNYVDRTTEASQITFMRYCPAMDRVLVCEEGRCVDFLARTPAHSSCLPKVYVLTSSLFVLLSLVSCHCVLSQHRSENLHPRVEAGQGAACGASLARSLCHAETGGS